MLFVQELCCGDVPQLLRDYAAVLPGAYSQSGALQTALGQLGSSDMVQLRPIDVARFVHLRPDELRVGDVPGLLEARQTAGALRAA